VYNGELYAIGVHISPYEHGNRFNLDPERNRKLLMHKREIIRLYSTVKQDGLTLVPTKCYFKDSKVKFEIGLARGKKDYDKRDVMAKKEAARDIDRAIKNSKKYN
jgi:SsrA-binding protein